MQNWSQRGSICWWARLILPSVVNGSLWFFVPIANIINIYNFYRNCAQYDHELGKSSDQYDESDWCVPRVDRMAPTGRYKSLGLWSMDLKDLCCNSDQHNFRDWCQVQRKMDVCHTLIGRWCGRIGRRAGHGKSTWKWSTTSTYYRGSKGSSFNINHQIWYY